MFRQPEELESWHGRHVGAKRYELTDHLGNVRAVVSDRRVWNGTSADPEVVSLTDYFPFGAERNGMVSGKGYRYGGAGGQEKVDEIHPNHYTAQYWEYDSRLGRRWNVDPVVKEHESPFAAFANNPIWFIDPVGADTIRFNSNTTVTHREQRLDRYTPPAVSHNFNINVTPSEGDDVFFWNTSTTSNYPGEESVTNSTSTQFYPDKLSRSGITSTPLYFGLYNQDDYDNVTLGKLMVANPALSDYLIEHNPIYQGYLSLGELANLVERSRFVGELVIGFAFAPARGAVTTRGANPM